MTLSGTALFTAVLEGIAACAELAPLHNPPNLNGVKACMALMPQVPQVVVFDTAFHQSMPEKAYLYGLPYELYVKYGVRRYGFHGTSHKYVAQEAARMMGGEVSDYRIITCHLGNGSSVAAVKYGWRLLNTANPLIPAWAIPRWTGLLWARAPARLTRRLFRF